MNLKLCCFFEVIVVDDDYDEDLFLVVNSYMQIGDDIDGDRIYEKC
jgi:hypothetical protein